MSAAQRLRAQGNERGAAKLEGEARQLQSMAGTGGRYEREKAITEDLSMSGGKVIGKTAVASVAKTKEEASMTTLAAPHRQKFNNRKESIPKRPR